MAAPEASWVATLAGRLEFHKANQHIADGDGVIRPRLQVGNGAFAHGDHSAGLVAAQLRQALEQVLERAS